MHIEYALWTEAWERFLPRLESLINEINPSRVCELGAGANPALTLEFVRERNLDYTLLDVSPDELNKAPAGYQRILTDLAAPALDVREDYDLAFSRMLAEHVSDPYVFHRNVHRLLRPGGKAFHFFPTLYALPFVLNRVVPERLTRWVLAAVQSGREAEGEHGKFRAYYRWCRGPTRRQFERLEAVGFRVEEYVGFFGDGYFERLPPLQRGSDALARFLVERPLPSITSYAFVVLEKSKAAANPLDTS